jgi:hypothetical protein
VELAEEGVVQQAEAGWRELLCEKRAKLRGRVTELDMQHAAARMIQVGRMVCCLSSWIIQACVYHRQLQCWCDRAGHTACCSKDDTGEVAWFNPGCLSS